MCKDISKLFLASILILFSFSFLNVNAQATENDQFVVYDPEIETITETTYLEINGSDSKEISKESFDKVKIEKATQESYEKANEDKLTYFDTDTLQESTTKQEIVPMATNTNHIAITTTHTYNSNTGTINLKSTITNIVGTKPSIIKTGYHLYHSKTLEGTYTKVGGSGYDIEWTGANIYVGKTHSKDYKVLATNFRMAKATSTAGWTGLGVKTSSDSSKPVLANKKAKVYPTVKNTHNGKTMARPTKANMPVVPAANRVPWNNTLRGNFISGYINSYGTPPWKWADYDIHHVIPREYGGSNASSNLFPVTRQIHQQTINPWWASY